MHPQGHHQTKRTPQQHHETICTSASMHLSSQQRQRTDPNSLENIYMHLHRCIYAVLRPIASAARPRYHAIQCEQTLLCILAISQACFESSAHGV